MNIFIRARSIISQSISQSKRATKLLPIRYNYGNRYYGSISSCKNELIALGVPIISPGGIEYNRATKIYNPAYTFAEYPAFVARPITIKQVQICLQVANKNATPIVLKSGGHSFAGYSSIDPTGFVILLDGMKSMEWQNDNTLKVSAGCNWSDVYKKISTDNDQKVIVGGCCPSVGIAGYVLGGGYGLLSRRYGLGSDNAIEMNMITADGGNIVTASNNENIDLFWALRGGGGGNFGVLIDVTFSLHDAEPAYYWTSLYFNDTESAQKALSFIGDNMNKIPDDVNVDMILSGNSDGSKQLSVDIVTSASRAEDDHDIVQFLRSLASTVKRSTEKFDSYTNLVLEYGTRHGYVHYESEPVYMKGSFINDMPGNVAIDLVNVKFPNDPMCLIEFVHVGGEISKKSSDYSAYVHREAQYNCYTYGRFGTAKELGTVMGFADTVNDLLKNDNMAKGSYVNYMDRYLHDWATEYYGSNYDKLCSIKEEWNSINNQGSLHFLQEIGSDYNPPDGIGDSLRC